MFVHVGGSRAIRERDIIGVFDTDNATLSSPLTRSFLREAEKHGRVEAAGTDIPKSFIIYRHRTGGVPDGYRVCFSELSVSALMQRLGSDQAQG
jgi:hypothetical protein